MDLTAYYLYRHLHITDEFFRLPRTTFPSGHEPRPQYTGEYLHLAATYVPLPTTTHSVFRHRTGWFPRTTAPGFNPLPGSNQRIVNRFPDGSSPDWPIRTRSPTSNGQTVVAPSPTIACLEPRNPRIGAGQQLPQRKFTVCNPRLGRPPPPHGLWLGSYPRTITPTPHLFPYSVIMIPADSSGRPLTLNPNAPHDGHCAPDVLTPRTCPQPGPHPGAPLQARRGRITGLPGHDKRSPGCPIRHGTSCIPYSIPTVVNPHLAFGLPQHRHHILRQYHDLHRTSLRIVR